MPVAAELATGEDGYGWKARGASGTYCAENTEPRWRQKESERARDPRLLQKEARHQEGGTNMRFRVRRAGLHFL